jgi:starch synthase
MKILYVAGEVAPFSDASAAARLMRVLPEAMQESGGYETRILMPRYGVVSERRNRLHEVIRLSGTEVPVGKESDTLKVKVASIPGIRLQVYFMDSVKYFKRKGLELDKKTGEPFPDNPARALFFARAALHTAKRLGWGPEVVHASGWITAFVGHVLRTEWSDDPLFEHAKVVYTPDMPEIPVALSADDAETLGLPVEWAGRELNEIGLTTADAAVYADEATVGTVEGPILSGDDPASLAEAGAAVYRTLAPERDLAA